MVLSETLGHELGQLEVVSLHQNTQQSSERSGAFENEIMRNENLQLLGAIYFFNRRLIDI